MKLRKIISMAVTAAIVMANAVIISAPTVSAAVEKTGTKYSQGFGSAAADYAKTLKGLKGQGWYAADNNQLYIDVDGTKQPYKATSGKFGQIVADPTGTANNYCLKVCSAGEFSGTVSGAVIKNYGYGTTFPGVEANSTVSGAWEIEFYFIPNFNGENVENSEFAFTINTSEGPNNLVSSDGTNMIVGGFNPTTASVPFSAAAMNIIPLQKATYKVRAFVNIDQGYYSVELWTGSTLIARRSPITLNSTDVKFLKFSALGISSACYVYIDNLSIKSAADSSSTLYAEGREKLIYSDDFSAYTSNTKASAAMTNEGSGTSFFGGKYTPWRAFANKDTYGNYSVTDGVLKLGKQSGTEKSAMIYALPGETIVDTTTERTRGMLNVSFKIKPENIKANNGFTVNLGSAPGASTQTAVFILGVTSTGEPKIMHLDGTGTVLNAEHWHTVNMTVDVINRGIKFVVTDDDDSNAEVDNYVQAPTSGNYMTPVSVGEIMFRAGDNAGSYAYLDDVNISYVTPMPSVDTSKIVMTDKFNNIVSETTDVTVSIDSIMIPLGTIANAITASNFTLVDDSSNPVSCTGTFNSGNTYTFGDTFVLQPSTLLQSGKTYILTVLTTVASVYGDTLASPVTFTFATMDSMQDLMSIKAVKVGGTAVSSLSDIEDNSTVNVEVKYANNTAEAITGTVIVAFYGNNRILDALVNSRTVGAGQYGTDSTTFSFDVPSEIEMSTVDKVSVFLWDGFADITPYCEDVRFIRAQ